MIIKKYKLQCTHSKQLIQNIEITSHLYSFDISCKNPESIHIIFSHCQISKNIQKSKTVKQSKHCHFQNFSKLIFTFHFSTFIYPFYSWKTPQIRGFVFSNYWSLNDGNLLLESGEILKQKQHKTTKNGMLKLMYIKVL